MQHGISFQGALEGELEVLDGFACREPGGLDPQLTAVGLPGGDFTLQAASKELFVGLTEGRVTVLEVASTRTSAAVRGDGAVWFVKWTPTGGWECDCPARSRCSHLVAVGLITVTVQPQSPPMPGRVRARP